MRAPPERADGDQREVLVRGELGAAPELLADDAAHAAAHEAEVHDGEHAVIAADLGGARDDGFGQAGLGLRLTQPVRVAFEVAELQRVEGANVHPQLAEGAVVHELE